MHEFPTDYSSILNRLQAIDPVAYSGTRNYLSGAVTKLSPYITHGVISTQDVGKTVLAKATYKKSETLLKELAWRDFYYATWNQLGDTIFKDIRYSQPLAHYSDMPAAILNASTGILALDQAIVDLVQTGYVHNHARLWLAMLCCNVGQTAWWNPSRWMYYHLLDGDLASNTISWQWVAGSYRKDPYLANQENINTFSGIIQNNTFLDIPYENLTQEVPTVLRERVAHTLTTSLVKTAPPKLQGEALLYHPWSLNPVWHKESQLPRVLLLEPNHFAQFPISKKRLAFILQLSKNISNLNVVVANFAEFAAENTNVNFHFMQHPAIAHWKGIQEKQDRLFVVSKPVTKDWSFSKFWHQCSITLHVDMDN